MKRFHFGACAVAALSVLTLAATAQAQVAYVQSSPAGSASYSASPSYAYMLSQTASYPSYSIGTTSYPSTSVYTPPIYSTSPSRVYIQPGQGYDWQSRTSYASYNRPATYAPGYAYTQPYYYAGQGYGTMTRGVLPNGASYRAWQPPSRIR
jgi:hypothetical protein